MDFDHARGIKEFELRTVSKTNISRKRILEEVAKCDVICSNCHRIRTFSKERNHPNFTEGVRLVEDGTC